MSTETKTPAVATPTPVEKVITVAQAKAHLEEVKNFVLGPKYNGKTGYNPYQWLHDRNVPALEAALSDSEVKQEDLKAIMALPKNEEPFVKHVKTKRVDEFFNEQLKKRKEAEAAGGGKA